MPPSQVALIVGLFIAVDLVVIPIVIRAGIVGSWGDLQKSWPGRPPADGAVVREFQSLRMGSTSFGGCVHIAVDEKHLHLLPAKFLRWFGAAPVSVPWESITDVRPAGRGKFASASLGGRRVTAPAWALELARGAPGGT